MSQPFDFDRYYTEHENMVGQDIEARFAAIRAMTLAELVAEAQLYERAVGVTESDVERWADRIVARLAVVKS